jgi:hypothetical protein
MDRRHERRHRHVGREAWQGRLHPEHIGRLPDGGPEGAVRVCAPKGRDHDAFHLLGIKFAIQPCVSRFNDPSVAVTFPYPLHQVHGGVFFAVLHYHDWPSTACDLKDKDAEAVDVGCGAGTASEHALWVHVAHSAGECGCVGLPFVVDEPGEPEVTKLGVEGSVEQDIAGLDVTVQNTLFPLLMQVQKCRTYSEHNLMPKQICIAAKWSIY